MKTDASAPRRSRWPKILGLFAALLLLLVVGGYFLITSPSFVKRFILPKVGEALRADVTAGGVSLSPFSQIVLKDVKAQVKNEESVFTAAELRVRYDLMKILRGNMYIEEIALVSPVISLVQKEDGTSNADPVIKMLQEPSEPMQIELVKLTVSNGTVRYTQAHPGGRRSVSELAQGNLTVENVKNGGTGKAVLAGVIDAKLNPPPPGTAGAANGKVDGNFGFTLTPALGPSMVNGQARIDFATASGALQQLAGFGGVLACDMTETEIRKAAVEFRKGNVSLGQVLASGPFNAQSMEGKLQVIAHGIDKQLLNIFGSAQGMDFGTTRIASTNLIELTKAGKVIAADGRFDLAGFQITRTNQSTPTLDLRALYKVNVDLLQSNALVQAFDVLGTQQGRDLLRGQLTSPMAIAWGKPGNEGVGDSSLNFSLTNLNVADWKPFLGDSVSAGVVNGRGQLVSQGAGSRLAFDLATQIQDLAARAGGNSFSGLNARLTARGTATNLAQYHVPEFRFDLARQGQTVLASAGSALYDLTNEVADVTLDLNGSLPGLLALAPQTNMNFSSGTLQARARVQQQKKNQTIAGNFVVTNLTGRIAETELQGYGAGADVDIASNGELVQIRKLTGQLVNAGQPGGNFNVGGTYNLNSSAAKITARLAGFNQNGLRPFVEPSLGDRKLQSIDLNGNADIQYDPSAPSSIKALVEVANLRVRDPRQSGPDAPLSGKLNLDASVNNQVTEIRECTVSLTPTSRATNQVRLTGKVDASRTNAIQGDLTLAADALDLTSYYDLYEAASKAKAQAPSPAPARGAAPPAVETEPEPIQLPFSNFVANASVRRLYLREVEVTDAQATVRLNGGHVVIEPASLGLNGGQASAKADVRVDVPGYKYDLALEARAVPLAPIVNSFSPERKGQVGGTIAAQAKIAGAGTTGVNLQRSLTGNFDFGTTNLNLSVANVRSPLMKALINVVVMIPDIARNPENAVGSLLSSLTNPSRPGQSGGLSSELERSPIDQITARGAMGSGKVKLENAYVRSPAFEALASGDIDLAPILTNSPIRIPVSISLNRAVAERANMVPANTPTNQAYIKLPDFVTMRGTLGQPKTEINKLALAGTVLRGVGGVLPTGSGSTGQLLQNLGNVLGGTPGAGGTNAPRSGTNAPASLGNVIGGLLGGTPATATTSTNSARQGTNAPPQSTLGGVLDSLLRPAPAPATNPGPAKPAATTPATNAPPAKAPAKK